MKKPNRQTLLIGGAVTCLLIALITLFSGSGGEPPAESAPPGADPQAELSNAISPTGSDGTAGSPAMNPEFYQRVRQQLLTVVPEHREPFTPRERSLPAASSSEVEPSSGARPGSLPVLPVALQPSLTGGSKQAVGGDADATGSFVGRDADATQEGKPTGEPNAVPRLRGQIRDRASGKITVLFELNGTLLRASNEPNAEWRIISIKPRQITVRSGERTLILEVPYAP